MHVPRPGVPHLPNIDTSGRLTGQPGTVSDRGPRRPFFVQGPELWGRLAGLAAGIFLIATIVRLGNEEWGWAVVMAIPVLPLGWLTLRLLDNRFN